MSERERYENAKEAGRRAYYAGLSVDECPFRADDSRLAWRNAWLAAEESYRESERLLKKQKERFAHGRG